MSDSAPAGQGSNLRAIEFYSGIGAFAQAARGFAIEIVAAYDQSRDAGIVYELNHGARPNPRNLDGITAAEIPEADLWWLSPPCTPFSRRGRRRDHEDPRAASLLNLIGLIALKRPRYLMLENVSGFAGSVTHERLLSALAESGYQVAEISMCSTAFGTPMKRPRYFVVASRGRAPSLPEPAAEPRPLASYLDDHVDESLLVDETHASRYREALNIVDPNVDASACLICFTSNYWKSMKASGSLLAASGGRVRRFSASEMLRLFGFPETFNMPRAMPDRTKWRLIGNSVDVRAVDHLLTAIASGSSTQADGL